MRDDSAKQILSILRRLGVTRTHIIHIVPSTVDQGVVLLQFLGSSRESVSCFGEFVWEIVLKRIVARIVAEGVELSE